MKNVILPSLSTEITLLKSFEGLGVRVKCLGLRVQGPLRRVWVEVRCVWDLRSSAGV